MHARARAINENNILIRVFYLFFFCRSQSRVNLRNLFVFVADDVVVEKRSCV